MLINQALQAATGKFQAVGINSAYLDARILLAYALDKPQEYLLSRYDEALPSAEETKFFQLVASRINLMPVAYLIGRREFYGRNFFVNNHVLIPRPDTELLIEAVIKLYSENKTKEFSGAGAHTLGACQKDEKKVIRLPSGLASADISAGATGTEDRSVLQVREDLSTGTTQQFADRVEFRKKSIEILELGAGSGCVIITLLLELPAVHATAIDISREALKVAAKNAAFHQVSNRLTLLQSDWFSNLTRQKFDIIVSNPPYIPACQENLVAKETMLYEPHLALFAENDGLAVYKIIADQAEFFLKHNGKLFLEIGFEAIERVIEIFNSKNYIVNGIYTDLSGYPRVVEFSKI